MNDDFKILLLVIFFDIVTGTILSIKNENIDSTINKEGITKHVTIILLVMFLTYIFNKLHLNNYIQIIIYFYLASYMLSIIENLDGLGVPFPDWLRKRFNKLKEDTNTNEIKRID